mgnify:CR=1 FL=1
MTDALVTAARKLAAALEPFAGQVYFAPEAHAEYVALGFNPSPASIGTSAVAMPDGPAYFTSRGSVMGQVPGELIASAFAVFNPAAVVPSVTYGWSLTDAATICAARDRGGIAQLERILGEKPDDIGAVGDLFERATSALRPEGRPLFAGLSSQPVPESPLGRAWRFADMLREYRGDAHTASWISEGVDATEICLLTDLYWNLPMRSYSRSRAWSDAQFDAAADRLRLRGLLEGDGYSDAGRALREQIETNTDMQMRSAIAVLGDDLDELCTILHRYGKAIKEAGGYLGGGPGDLVGTGS